MKKNDWPAIRLSKKTVWRKVDDEAVIMNIENGNYYSLDEIGTEIWEQFVKGLSLGEIIQKIAGKYGVESGMVQRDIEKLIKTLLKEKIIVRA